MKKQPVYLLLSNGKGQHHFERVEGEVIDLTNNKGYTTQIALLYKRPFWCATHVLTGMDCTLKPFKRKEDLIKNLKEIDFELFENKPYMKYYIQELRLYKETHQ